VPVILIIYWQIASILNGYVSFTFLETERWRNSRETVNQKNHSIRVEFHHSRFGKPRPWLLASRTNPSHLNNNFIRVDSIRFYVLSGFGAFGTKLALCIYPVVFSLEKWGEIGNFYNIRVEFHRSWVGKPRNRLPASRANPSLLNDGLLRAYCGRQFNILRIIAFRNKLDICVFRLDYSPKEIGE
jgi:hypothetical protein